MIKKYNIEATIEVLKEWEATNPNEYTAKNIAIEIILGVEEE